MVHQYNLGTWADSCPERQSLLTTLKGRLMRRMTLTVSLLAILLAGLAGWVVGNSAGGDDGPPTVVSTGIGDSPSRATDLLREDATPAVIPGP
jgi:hypothetical protein